MGGARFDFCVANPDLEAMIDDLYSATRKAVT